MVSGGGTWTGPTHILGGSLGFHAGPFQLSPTATISGASGMVVVDGAAVTVNSVIDFTGTWQLAKGSVAFVASQPAFGADLVVSGGSFSLLASSVFLSAFNMSAGVATIDNSVTIQGAQCTITGGTLIISASLVMSTSCAVSGSSTTLAGTGTLSISGGALSLSVPNALVGPAVVISAGGRLLVFSVTAFAQTVTVSSGAVELTGATGFQGGFKSVGSGTLSVGAAAAISGGSCVLAGGTVTVVAGQTLVTSVVCNVSAVVAGAGVWQHSPVTALLLAVSSSSFTASLFLSGAASCTVAGGSVSFLSPVTVGPGASLSIGAEATTFVGGLSSQGAVTVTSVAGVYGGSCYFLDGSVVVQGALSVGVSGSTSGAAVVSGSGRLDITGGTFTLGVDAATIEPALFVGVNGTLSVAVGSVFSQLVTVEGMMTVSASSTANGGITQSGSLGVNAGVLSVSGGSYLLAQGGQLVGAGSLTSSVVVVVASGPVTISINQVRPRCVDDRGY